MYIVYTCPATRTGIPFIQRLQVPRSIRTSFRPWHAEPKKPSTKEWHRELRGPYIEARARHAAHACHGLTAALSTARCCGGVSSTCSADINSVSIVSLRLCCMGHDQ